MKKTSQSQQVSIVALYTKQLRRQEREQLGEASIPTPLTLVPHLSLFTGYECDG